MCTLTKILKLIKKLRNHKFIKYYVVDTFKIINTTKFRLGNVISDLNIFTKLIPK